MSPLHGIKGRTVLESQIRGMLHDHRAHGTSWARVVRGTRGYSKFGGVRISQGMAVGRRVNTPLPQISEVRFLVECLIVFAYVCSSRGSGQSRMGLYPSMRRELGTTTYR